MDEHTETALTRLLADSGCKTDTDHWTDKAAEESRAEFEEENDFELNYPVKAKVLFTPLKIGKRYEIMGRTGVREVEVKNGIYKGEQEYRMVLVDWEEDLALTVTDVWVKGDRVHVGGRVESSGKYTLRE